MLQAIQPRRNAVNPTADADANPLGTGGIATDDGLALTSDQWIALQVFATQGLALPQDNTSLAQLLQTDVGTVQSQFNDLLPAFTQVRSDCLNWSNTLYPAVVDLANGIASQGTNAVRDYGALQDVIAKLKANPNDADAASDFSQVLASLKSAADAAANSTSSVVEQLTAYGTAIDQDQTQMNTLAANYQAQYGSTSGTIQTLQATIADLTTQASTLNAEYQKDVAIASTTPAYAWVGFPIFPVGLIAAVAVDSVYGPRAKALKTQYENTETAIQADQAQLQTDIRLLGITQRAATSASGMSAAIAAGLPVIQQLEGGWTEVSGNLADLETAVANIGTDPSFLQGLDIQQAITDWQNAGTAAAAFVQNAYVQVSGTPS